MPAPHLTTDLEKKRLNEFLKELQKMFVCIGVTESSLQEHAGPPAVWCSQVILLMLMILSPQQMTQR